MAKLKRFHKEIFFPSWHKESIDEFIQQIVDSGPLTFSLHSVDNILFYVDNNGKKLWKSFLKIVRKNLLDKSKIFEFYSSKDKKIKKSCFRFSLEDSPVDLILVVSDTGIVITVFVTNKDDTHKNINKSLYDTKE